MFDLYGLDPLNSGSSGAAALGAYKTSDAFDDLLEAGYFNEGAANLKATQALLVKASDKTGILLISVSAGVVIAEEFGASPDPVAVSWDDIEGKPEVIASGETQDLARLSIGAGTSDLTLSQSQAGIASKASIAALASNDTADATDEASTMALANSLKTSVNAIIAALKA